MPTAIGQEGVCVTEAQIKEVFAAAKTQNDYIIELHKLVYPDFDQMPSVPRPSCTEACGKFSSAARRGTGSKGASEGSDAVWDITRVC